MQQPQPLVLNIVSSRWQGRCKGVGPRNRRCSSVVKPVCRPSAKPTNPGISWRLAHATAALAWVSLYAWDPCCLCCTGVEQYVLVRCLGSCSPLHASFTARQTVHDTLQCHISEVHCWLADQLPHLCDLGEAVGHAGDEYIEQQDVHDKLQSRRTDWHNENNPCRRARGRRPPVVMPCDRSNSHTVW